MVYIYNICCNTSYFYTFTFKILSMNKLWDIWCKAIGSKAYRDNKKSDKVAIIRTIWVVLHVVTCIAIMLNTLRSYQVL